MSPRVVRSDDYEASNAGWVILLTALLLIAVGLAVYFAWYAPGRERGEQTNITVQTEPAQPPPPAPEMEVTPPPPPPSQGAGPSAGREEGTRTTEPERSGGGSGGQARNDNGR